MTSMVFMKHDEVWLPNQNPFKNKGCGKPEYSKKTGNITINCGDELDEGKPYLCPDCKKKFDEEKATINKFLKKEKNEKSI